MTDMEAFVREQQDAYVKGQARLAELAEERGVNLDGVKALKVNYDTVRLDDDPTLQGLQRRHQRNKADLVAIYDVSANQSDRPAPRRTPLKAI